MQQLQANLKFLLNQLAVSQAQLEKAIDKRQQTISNWLNGKSDPDASDLVKMSQFFGVGIDDLCLTDLSKGNLISEDFKTKWRQIGNLKGNLLGNPMAQNHHFSGNPGQSVEQPDDLGIWAVIQVLKSIEKKIDAFGAKLDRMQLPKDSGQGQG